jgi:predicted N-acyltransferase
MKTHCRTSGGLVVRAPIRLRSPAGDGLAAPHFLAVDAAALGEPWVAAHAANAVYSWTIRNPAERAQAEVQADALIWEAMADRNLSSRQDRVGRLGLNAHAWDRLAGGDPFAHPCLPRALEDSGSVGPGTGWTPAPILVEDENERLVAAAPAYLKVHSQGEYVFDHGWADAWQRAGGEYYPKLQVSVPFTPVPGPRLLGSRPQQLLAALEAVTIQHDMSSAHITFIDDAAAAECQRRGWLMRHGVQYHWFNRGYASFDDFLATLSSRKRKTLRKERAAAVEGLEIRILRGSEIGPAEWDAMWAFYQDTGSRKWGRPYLTREFFDLVGERMGDAVLLFLACRDCRRSPARSTSSAATRLRPLLGDHRRGAVPPLRALLLPGVEWAIDHGLQCVQAGAQGEHKLARGYEPVITRRALHSEPSFRDAVADFLEAERAGVARGGRLAAAGLPYRSSLAGVDPTTAAVGVGEAAIHGAGREAPRRVPTGRRRSGRPSRRATECRQALRRAPAAGSRRRAGPARQLDGGDRAE